MAIFDEPNMRALHINLISGGPADPANPLEGLTQDELAYVEWKRNYDLHETAYQVIQGTKPQSLAYGLTDSPSGLAAWIVEKFRRWSDCDGDVERAFTKDRLLENVMLYWLTGTINPANRMYYELMGPGPLHRSASPCGGPHRPCQIPCGNPPNAPRVGGTRLQHRGLAGHVQGRPFRGHGAAASARGRNPTICSRLPASPQKPPD